MRCGGGARAWAMRNKIVLHDVPEPEALARSMEQAAEVLAYRFPDLLACRLAAGRVTPGGQEFEVHVDLLLPQQQFILNRAASTAEQALKDALGAVWSAPSVQRHLRASALRATPPRATRADPLPAFSP